MENLDLRRFLLFLKGVSEESTGSGYAADLELRCKFTWMWVFLGSEGVSFEGAGIYYVYVRCGCISIFNRKILAVLVYESGRDPEV